MKPRARHAPLCGAARGQLLASGSLIVLLLGGAGGCRVAAGLESSVDDSCEVGASALAEGASVPAEDGCNTCSCTEGELLCTERACPSEALACGGRLGDTCADDEYCAYINGDCGFADGTATCRARPEFCTDVYAPVCGCDGKTYDNACAAAAAGHGYLSEGPCPGEGASCVIDGNTYEDGSIDILSADGCNVCFCNDGIAACTMHLCQIVPSVHNPT